MYYYKLCAINLSCVALTPTTTYVVSWSISAKVEANFSVGKSFFLEKIFLIGLVGASMMVFNDLTIGTC